MTTSTIRRATTSLLTLLLLSSVAGEGQLSAQALEADGAAALGVALRRLGTAKRVLMIAAHPDDENTALIAELALGGGADVAYLSLTRGEGGQNLIGPELQEALGVIRSEELLAARRLDGARQFFTRAYDFGFSRRADETLRQWPRDSVLGDIVEVVRRYRPDIIVSVFAGTPADGHGHHQAAGILARQAFDAAADSTAFADQLRRGLAPHRAHYLFQSHWRPPPQPPLTVSVGELDPLFGRSRFQVAMRSRSRHRSQDMGQEESPGRQHVALSVLAGAYPADAASLFAALDTTLAQHARTAGASAHVLRSLHDWQDDVARIRGAFNPLAPHLLVAPLAAGIRRLHALRDSADGPLRFHLLREIEDAEEALRLAAGVSLDAIADAPHVVAGETFTLTLRLCNGGRTPITVHRLAPDLPAGWTSTAVDTTVTTRVAAPAQPPQVAPGDVLERRFRIRLPSDADASEAYFLRAPRDGAAYTWSVADSLRALPFEPRPVRASAAVDVGAHINLATEADFLEIDKALGEVRTPVLVVDAVSLHMEPTLLVVGARDAAPRTVTVRARSMAAGIVAGTLRITAPAGWHVEPAAVDVAFQRRGDEHTYAFAVTPPATGQVDAVLRARFDTPHRSYTRGFDIIDYPHIQPHAIYRDAATRSVGMDVRIATVAEHGASRPLRIGYIEGAGDDGAAALRQLGAHVDALDGETLARGDLARYDAIIAGIRAYEVRPDLVASNQRLLDYAHAGGTFVVQYNKYELVEGGFMPFPATMARPHGRITDESAPVTLLDPGHPLLAAPNRITTADFDGWVQERGLYFLDSFDDRYTPLLSMTDPGEQPLRGGLVAARTGSGWYVYAGLALFRQLPEGVPGAWRLLANLASLGHTSR